MISKAMQDARVDYLHAVGGQGGAIWHLDSKMSKRGKG